MENKNENVIDLTCEGCGGTVQPKKIEGAETTVLPNGNIYFTVGNTAQIFECPNCKKSFVLWKAGPETSKAWGVDARVSIGGNVSGRVSIVIGDGNIVNG